MAKTAPTIEQLIARHHELQELIELVRQAPQPLPQAIEDSRRVIEALAREWSVDLEMVWLARPGEWLATARAMLTPGTHNLVPLSPPVFLAKTAPKLLEEFFATELARTYETLPAPIAAQQRAIRLAELSRDHETNQTAMATAWWQLADAGTPIPPPEELEPWALLGIEREAA